jgi:hypothetical protein
MESSFELSRLLALVRRNDPTMTEFAVDCPLRGYFGRVVRALAANTHVSSLQVWIGTGLDWESMYDASGARSSLDSCKSCSFLFAQLGIIAQDCLARQ